MELITYALLKPLFPFMAIIALCVAGWVLSDLTVWRLSGRERSVWAFAILIFPPLGSMLYGIMGKKNSETEEAA